MYSVLGHRDSSGSMVDMGPRNVPTRVRSNRRYVLKINIRLVHIPISIPD